MNEKQEYVNEKKEWWPVSETPCEKPENETLPGPYFIAIEELKGAWVNGVWEPADAFVEEWDEEFIDSNGLENVRTVRRETKAARRYVLKRFTSSGFVENVHTSGGPRKSR